MRLDLLAFAREWLGEPSRLLSDARDEILYEMQSTRPTSGRTPERSYARTFLRLLGRTAGPLCLVPAFSQLENLRTSPCRGSVWLVRSCQAARYTWHSRVGSVRSTKLIAARQTASKRELSTFRTLVRPNLLAAPPVFASLIERRRRIASHHALHVELPLRVHLTGDYIPIGLTDRTFISTNARALSGVTKRMSVLTVAGQKGGSGKSTLVRNLAIHFALDGYRVGIVDADLIQQALQRILR